MKKILLSLLCLAGFASLQATEVSVTFSELGYENAQEVSSLTMDDNISVTFDKGSNSNTPKYYNSGTAFRLYGGNTMTIESSNSAVIINTVTITSQSGNYVINEASTVSAGTLAIDGTTGTITGINSNTVTFTQGGTSGHVRMLTLTVDYSVGEVTQVSKPVITPNGGEVMPGTEVTISCATEGAAIYYTVDGTAPSTTSTPYSAPFAINEACTVQAIAVLEGMDNSNVASATFTIIETATYGYVKTVTSGKNYLIFANDKIANPLTSNYGYVPTSAVTDENGYITEDKRNAFTITAIEGGYTIQDADGYYYYGSFKPDGTTPYNSLNRSVDYPTDGAVWTIEAQSDGTMKIANTYTSCYLQFDSSYGNFGCYAEVKGAMPFLYEEGATAQEKPEAPIEEVATIAEWLEKASTAKVKITGTVTVMYQNGRYLYVKDETSALLVYGDLTNKYSNGDQLTGITGSYTNYSQGLFEMIPDDTTFVAATAGTAVEPEQVQVEDIAVDQVSQYIVLKGVSVVQSTDDTGAAVANTYTVTDDSGSITLYNQFNNASYYDVVEVVTSETKTLTVEGFISVRNGVAQVVPAKVSDPSGVETIEAEESNAPVEYYNMQGVKVAHPESGLFIRVQGNKATKVLVK